MIREGRARIGMSGQKINKLGWHPTKEYQHSRRWWGIKTGILNSSQTT